MSPSSRYRTSIPDRYREMPPKCPDRLVTPVHYLANSTPMASNDNFAYLTSSVHTPVKRYIPTPPTPEPESDTMSTCSSGGYHLPGPGTPHISIQQSSTQQQQQQQQQVPKLLTQPNNAYAYRLKCCPNPNEQPGNTISPRATPPIVSTLDPGDHYATPACVKHMKTPVNGSATLGRMPRQQICPVNMARAPSVEYIGNNGSRVLTPVSFVSDPGNANCLHCSTLRRTTGIHQTTQTTGPISPTTQPLSLPPPSNQISNDDMCDPKQMIRNPLPPSSSLSFQSITSQQQQKSQHPSQQQQQTTSQQQQNQLAQLQQQVAAQAQQLQAVASQVASAAPLSPIQPQMLQTSPQPNPPSPQDQPIIQQQQNVGNQRSLVIQHQYRESPSSTMSSMTTLQRAGVQQRQPDRQRFFHKQQIKDYIKRETQRFFGVYVAGEEDELVKWSGRYNRLALRRFGRLKEENDENLNHHNRRLRQAPGDRPDILPEQSTDETLTNSSYTDDVTARTGTLFYRKASVPKMMWNGLTYVVRSLSTKRVKTPKQYSRSFAPAQIHSANDDSDLCEGLTPIQDDEVFFDILNTNGNGRGPNGQPQQYMSERVNGWRIKSTEASPSGRPGLRSTRISFRLLDGVLDNSRRPVAHEIKYHRHIILDDRYDHRPFFTYWINTVHVLIMILTLVCYGIGPIGFGVEQKTGQVLVTSLSLQQVTHAEYRNMWIGPRDLDLVHLGAKFAACMRKDHKILQVMAKTRRQERETACCIRNDDSGCVQSSQADCSVRGLWPTVISLFCISIM